jgi:hypothetical protein
MFTLWKIQHKYEFYKILGIKQKSVQDVNIHWLFHGLRSKGEKKTFHLIKKKASSNGGLDFRLRRIKTYEVKNVHTL